MKRLLFSIAILSSLLSFGQQNLKVIDLRGSDNNSKIKGGTLLDTKTLNLGKSIDTLTNSNMNKYIEWLWPDSTIKSPNGKAHKILAAGQSIDPYSISLVYGSNLPGYWYDVNYQNYLDTIGIYCVYERKPHLQNVVDTLILQIKFGKQSEINMSQTQNPWIFYYYYRYNLLFNGINHDAGELISSNPEYYTFKVLLDSSTNFVETATNLQILKVPVHLQVPVDFTIIGGNVLGDPSVTFNFKPGFSWNQNVDTITEVNNFSFCYYSCLQDFPIFDDLNLSYFIHSDRLNNIQNPTLFFPSNIPDSLYSPMFIFTNYLQSAIVNIDYIYTSYSFESIDDHQINQVKLFPNPTSELITIEFANPVSELTRISIYDICGSLVQTEQIAKGTKSFKMNIGSLSPGIYNYNVEGFPSMQGKVMLVR